MGDSYCGKAGSRNYAKRQLTVDHHQPRRSVLEVHMKPQTRHQDRSAVAVVAGIVYALQVESGVDTPPDVDVVVSLEDVFAPVIESAIAQQKAQSTQPQIILVIFLDGVAHNYYPNL